jgi:hypothetical protein
MPMARSGRYNHFKAKDNTSRIKKSNKCPCLPRKSTYLQTQARRRDTKKPRIVRKLAVDMTNNIYK